MRAFVCHNVSHRNTQNCPLKLLSQLNISCVFWRAVEQKKRTQSANESSSLFGKKYENFVFRAKQVRTGEQRKTLKTNEKQVLLKMCEKKKPKSGQRENNLMLAIEDAEYYPLKMVFYNKTRGI